eukprot:TRINITY_DN4200_c0_g1_i1.p1 TRINITY_DN4200_c0_g1~~TRINITY_DN4200_c0_g1_i1.p1  ORF type:complete len:354 (-),score=44.31 TRINITY_DN4200_c0_g1_i1:139-1200(-)
MTSPEADKNMNMRRGRPIKYPRPADCVHVNRPEHARGVCYQCSSNINNQKKREKKGSPPPPGSTRKSPGKRHTNEDGEKSEKRNTKKKRKDSSNPQANAAASAVAPTHYPQLTEYLEINVGGKIFATTLHTIVSQPSLLSMVQSHRFDAKGRLFYDRDGTHFRWILNFLRDGRLLTVPSRMEDKLELLQEARYYNLIGLIARLNMDGGGGGGVGGGGGMIPYPEKPTFQTARPSTKGVFFWADSKWSQFFPRTSWQTIAVRFEEGKSDVTFISFGQQGNSLTLNEICTVPLQVGAIAKATIDPFESGETVEIEFWWEPSSGLYPQLNGRVSSKKYGTKEGALDFYRTVEETNQ